MPTLADYRRLAPFSLEELVDAANSIMRERPRLQVNLRTVRYYISKDLLPRPRGAPKVARYGFEHLVKLVGYRCLQDEGRSLEEARIELENEPEPTEFLDVMLSGRPPQQAMLGMVAESMAPYNSSPYQNPTYEQFIRIPLRGGAWLAIPETDDLPGELISAAEEIQRIIRNL